MEEEQLQRAADVLLRDLLRVQQGETVVITADQPVEPALAEALSRAAAGVRAKRLTVWMDTPAGVSEAADPDLPLEALVGMLSAADVWIELNNHWLLYSNIYYQAMKNNRRLRHMELTGADCRTLIDCVGNIDYPAMAAFTALLRDKIKAGRRFRMTSAKGEDVRFVNQADQPVSAKLGLADQPGTHLFVGQIGWLPQPDSINGIIVFDGSVAPDIGVLREPVVMTIQAGAITKISGGEQAGQYEA